MELFGGLPYNTSLISFLTLIAYILLLLIGDCASGIPAARLLLRPQEYMLVRAGWRKWFRLVLLRCCLSALAVCGVLLIPALLRFPARETFYAWLLFTLHMEMIAAVQVLLIALLESGAAASVPVLFVQLVSLLLSRLLPGAAALLLPGNWGSLSRTEEFEFPKLFRVMRRSSAAAQEPAERFRETVAANLHGGFPLWAAVAGNLAVLLFICLFGWRLSRRKHQRK